MHRLPRQFSAIRHALGQSLAVEPVPCYNLALSVVSFVCISVLADASVEEEGR